MTDREILEEVYHMAVQDKRMLAPDRFCNKIVSFIEQEWMKYDDKYNHPFHQLDVQEIERREGLEIGEDGTVKE